MSSNTTSSMSYLTPYDVQAVLLAPLQQASTFLSQGAPIVYQTSGVPVHVPMLSAFGTPTWTAEGTALTEVAATQSEVILLPSTIRKTASVTRITRELAKQSIVDISGALQAKMVTDVANTLDYAFYQGGTATTGSPVGIFNSTNGTAVGTAIGTALSTSHLFTADQQAGVNNLNDAALKWVMSPESWSKVRRLAGTDGQFYMQQSLTGPTTKQLLGHPVIVSNNVPNTAIALVDFSKVAVAIDTNAEIQILTELYAATDEIGVKVVARADLAVLYSGAVIKLTGITP